MTPSHTPKDINSITPSCHPASSEDAGKNRLLEAISLATRPAILACLLIFTPSEKHQGALSTEITIRNHNEENLEGGKVQEEISTQIIKGLLAENFKISLEESKNSQINHQLKRLLEENSSFHAHLADLKAAKAISPALESFFSQKVSERWREIQAQARSQALNTLSIAAVTREIFSLLSISQYLINRLKSEQLLDPQSAETLSKETVETIGLVLQKIIDTEIPRLKAKSWNPEQICDHLQKYLPFYILDAKEK